MRKVFPSDMVAHLWANQSQDEARESGYRMYFEGKIIYSYGSHFPIARIVDGNTILFTSREYSSTTSKHKHTVRCAIDRSRYMVFTVDNVLADYKATHKENYKKLLNEYNYLLEKASKARSRANMFLHDADVMRTMLNDYSKYFKLGYKSIELPASGIRITLTHLDSSPIGEFDFVGELLPKLIPVLLESLEDTLQLRSERARNDLALIQSALEKK